MDANTLKTLDLWEGADWGHFSWGRSLAIYDQVICLFVPKKGFDA